MGLKKFISIGSLLLASAAAFYASAAVDAPYEVGAWGNFCQGAVSHTFDDNMNTNPNSPEQKLYDDKKFHMTMCVQTGSANWANCRASFAKGHEVSSHTVAHSSSTDGFEKSQKAIQDNVAGEKCVTVAYPDCQQNGANTLKYFLAGRNCTGSPVNSTTPTKWDQINSQMFGSGAGNYDNTATGLNNYANQAVQAKGWSVYCFHGIGDQKHSWATISLDAIKGHLDYLDKNRDKVWIETFGNVARYIKERDAASITKKDSTDKGIAITVTDNLADSTFNYPLSIRRELPSGWTTAVVTQKGKDIEDTIVTVSSKKYIMFKAVPDGGDVLISKDGTGVNGYSFKRSTSGASPVKFVNRTISVDSRFFNGSDLNIELFDLRGKEIAHYKLSAGLSRITLPDQKICSSAFIANISGSNAKWTEKFIPQL